MATSDISAPDLKTAIRDDKFVDCTPCRLIGTGAFVALGGYAYFSGHSQLRENYAEIVKKGGVRSFKMRQFGITGTAAALVGVGMYRLLAE